MKGRSQRPPPEPSDDWATDGSWTVACSCGVTFDDGEEMVSCDECGVWVHTRCARFARGAPSFSCHTCTARRDTTSNETEVAQLLADLPSNLPPLPLRRPHAPLHDRVHVHGLPGGDPALFSSSAAASPLFSQHLWKCAGYVPKKFTFHYRDFPFSDNDNDSESPASTGADVLFSLSKEAGGKAERNRISMLGANWGKRRKDEFREHRKKRPRDGLADKKRESGSVDGKCEDGKDESVREDGMGKAGSKPKNIFVIKASRGRLRDEVTRKRSSLATSVGVEEAEHREPLVARGQGSDTVGEPTENEDVSTALHGLKQSKDETHFEGVLNGNYCAVVIENSKPVIDNLNLDGEDGDAREVPHTFGAPSMSSKLNRIEVKMEESDGKDRILQDKYHFPQHLQKPISLSSDNIQKNLTDVTLPSCGQNSQEAQRNSEASSQTCDKIIESKASRFSVPKFCGQVAESLGSSTVPKDLVEPRQGLNIGSMELGSSYPSLSTVSVGKLVVGFGKASSSSAASANKSLGEAASSAVNNVVHLTKQQQVKMADEGDRTATTEYTEESIQEVSRHTDNVHNKDPEFSGSKSSHVSGNSYVSSKNVILLDSKEQPVSPPPTTFVKENIATMSSSSGTTGSKSSHVCEDSSISSKHTMLDAKEPLVSQPPQASTTDNPALLSRSSGTKVLKSLRPCKDSHVSSKHYVSSKHTLSDSKEHLVSPPHKASATDTTTTVSKSGGATRSKSSHVCKDSYSSKHALSDSKEHPCSPRSKASTRENTAALPCSSEATGALQKQKEFPHTKLMSSSPCQKNEKISEPVSQPSLKVFNHSTPMHPPAAVNITTTLSDEELALLLHQELNSSPRVPRVPRVRQAVGMQLATQTATSMLKRSSSSVGKDQVSISKRKSKEDTSRENSRNSRDSLDESKRMHVISSSSDQKPQGPTSITDGSAKKDMWNRSLDATTRGEKIIPVGAVEGTIGSPTSFEANGQKGLSVRSSPREVPNDVGALTSRTLPGLIGDILSHGRHMTYEEICEAVRPHWRKMRKLNGERYAYSSHSLAVLDCLRNRNEWSHLVDRGPKTNTSKRKRKPDSDSPTVESENEEAGNSSWREAEDKRLDSHHEDFPKGKRKARKRRRLELKGKGVKEALQSRNQDPVADADPAAFSHSSNDVTEGNFSEDDSQGAGRPGAGDGVSSSSSDDTD